MNNEKNKDNANTEKYFKYMRIELINSQNQKIKEIQKQLKNTIGFNLSKTEFVKIGLKELIKETDKDSSYILELLEKYNYI